MGWGSRQILGNMNMNHDQSLVRVLPPVLIVCLLSSAQTTSQSTVNDLRKAIAAVRSGPSTTARTKAAEDLATLTKRMGHTKIDNASVMDIASLLDSPEDSVRAWAAAALGNLGPRAKASVPKLRKLLAEVNCLPGELTSAPFVRMALQKIGEKNLPPECD